MNKQKYPPVLVTGASSGIGRHLCQYLAERGQPVYGTVRNEDDFSALQTVENVTPLLLDVRNAGQIAQAVETITQAGTGLYGLVNNAGLGGLGLHCTWSDEELFEIFDVNVFGPHRMTNAFLPLLFESHGRVVNIGSQGGMISKKYFGPYTMTKHALEAYTVSLNEELSPYGVRVSIVQPGGIVSNIGRNAEAGMIARFQRAQEPFRKEIEQVMAIFTEIKEEEEQVEESESNRKPSSPEIVSVAVYDALFSPTPKLRYLVGTQWEGDRVLNALVEKLLDENDNPQHSYSREQLIAMLDRHMTARQE